MSLAKTWHFSWNEFISLSLFVPFLHGVCITSCSYVFVKQCVEGSFWNGHPNAIKHIGIRVFGRKGSDDSPEEVEVGDVGFWCGFVVEKNTPGATNIAGWNMDTGFLLKMVIFHSYVSLPEGSKK